MILEGMCIAGRQYMAAEKRASKISCRNHNYETDGPDGQLVVQALDISILGPFAILCF